MLFSIIHVPKADTKDYDQVTDYEKNAIEISQADTNNKDKFILIDYEKKVIEIIFSQADKKNDDQEIAISQTHRKMMIKSI